MVKFKLFQDVNDLEQKISMMGHNGSLENVKEFRELPLSKMTRDALSKGGFLMMTEIQKATILPSLCGRDVVASSHTGSGKRYNPMILMISYYYYYYYYYYVYNLRHYFLFMCVCIYIYIYL